MIAAILVVGLAFIWLLIECDFIPAGLHRHGRFKAVRVSSYFVFFVFLLFTLTPLLSLLLFQDIPQRSDEFDCDDATLFMFDRLSSLGINSIPVAGDLTRTGEKYFDINHVWLLVDVAGIAVPFDWATPWLDSQHLEGYAISYGQLQAFVEQDKVQRGITASLPGN